jgi:hypothetical protein
MARTVAAGPQDRTTLLPRFATLVAADPLGLPPVGTP